MNIGVRILGDEYIKVEPKKPPPYINELLIQRILEIYYKCHAVLSKYRIYCVTNLGETFFSEIYRVIVDFTMYYYGEDILYNPTRHEVSLIVKDVKCYPGRREGPNEYLLNKYVLEHLKQILKSVHPNEYSLDVIGHHERVCKVSPNCLFCYNGPYEVYILEDLTRHSFCQPNRFDGLNLIESQYVMKKLAHIHAASMEYLRHNPLAVNAFLPSPLAKGISPKSFLGVSTFEGMRYAIEIVKYWPGYEDIAELMSVTMEKFNERLIEVMAHKHCAFKVLVHGEPWAKNIFMKYAQWNSDVSPRDATFVDFQMSFFGSCGFDINYFLQTSVQVDVLQNHRLQLIKWYYVHLKRTLVKLNYPSNSIPTMSMILFEMLNFEFIGYYAMLVHLPMACMDEDTTTDFRPEYLFNFEERTLFYDIIYNYKRVHDMFQYGLRRFVKYGVI